MKRMSLILSYLMILFLGVSCAPAQSTLPVAISKALPSVPGLYELTRSGLYALSTATGQKLWQHKLTLTHASSVQVNGENVYLDDGHELSALAIYDGTLRWHYRYQARPATGPRSTTLLIGQKSLYLVDGNDPLATVAPAVTPVHSTLLAFNPESGQLLWKKKLAYRLNDPVVSAETIYGIGSTAQQSIVYALDGATGLVKWHKPLAASASTYSNLTATTEALYIVQTMKTLPAQWQLNAFASRDGSSLWHSALLTGDRLSQPTVTGGLLYTIVGGHHVYAFDTQNGHVHWTRIFADTIETFGVPIANGQVYLVKQRNPGVTPLQVLALNAVTGQSGWSWQALPAVSPHPGVILFDQQQLYLEVSGSSANSDQLVLIKQASGAQLTSYPLPARLLAADGLQLAA